MKPYKTDIAVLIVFFCREKQLSEVFKQVKEARPSKLYLYQDGPRNDADIEHILKCREIVSDIDWDCTVHTFFQEKNFGCDPSGHIAHNWMLRNEEYGIILEDDTVPSQSFFPYCKELLELYKNDTRIRRISGMNNLEVSEEVDESYFFAFTGSIWGWATWNRTLKDQDTDFSFLDSRYYTENMSLNFMGDRSGAKKYLNLVKKRKNEGVDYFESIESTAQYLNSQLNIIPKYNMITNIGIDSESTHSTANIKHMPRSVRKLFYMKRYETEMPLVHPKFIICNKIYEKKRHKNSAVQFLCRLEGLILRIIYTPKKELFKIIMRKFR